MEKEPSNLQKMFMTDSLEKQESKTPEESFRFIQNKSCIYFPCHENADPNTFNCLFCYCPLYFLGEKCKGNYTKIGVKGEIKDCTNCLIPHKPENYGYIVKMVGDHLEQF